MASFGWWRARAARWRFRTAKNTHHMISSWMQKENRIIMSLIATETNQLCGGKAFIPHTLEEFCWLCNPKVEKWNMLIQELEATKRGLFISKYENNDIMKTNSSPGNWGLLLANRMPGVCKFEFCVLVLEGMLLKGGFIFRWLGWFDERTPANLQVVHKSNPPGGPGGIKKSHVVIREKGKPLFFPLARWHP